MICNNSNYNDEKRMKKKTAGGIIIFLTGIAVILYGIVSVGLFPSEIAIEIEKSTGDKALWLPMGGLVLSAFGVLLITDR